MSELEVDRSQSPGTPPPPPTNDGILSPTPAEPEEDEEFREGAEEDETPNRSRGKKRHRRAKGKKKKQKTNLMITNEDGTNSTEVVSSKQKKNVFLRPSKNPLLNAPKNSTQFIMDDHENSNLFWNFDSNRCNDSSKEDLESVGDESNEALEAAMVGDHDDNYWAAYLEKDFESVYETAHQEEIYSWNRTRIIDEISSLEKRQKQLIDMLSQIDPMIYLQKLQSELLSLQEENRQLRLINIAERDRRQRTDSSSPRMPDSTTVENSDTTDDDSSSSSDDDESDGGCGSGCCLLREELDQRLEEVTEESVDIHESVENDECLPHETVENVPAEEASTTKEEAVQSGDITESDNNIPGEDDSGDVTNTQTETENCD